MFMLRYQCGLCYYMVVQKVKHYVNTLWGIKTHQNVFHHNFHKTRPILNKLADCFLNKFSTKAMQTIISWLEYQLRSIWWNLKVTNASVTEAICLNATSSCHWTNMCDPNVKQEKVMFNLAAVRNAVPLRKRRLAALAPTVQWLYQRRSASAQPRHR